MSEPKHGEYVSGTSPSASVEWGSESLRSPGCVPRVVRWVRVRIFGGADGGNPRRVEAERGGPGHASHAGHAAHPGPTGATTPPSFPASLSTSTGTSTSTARSSQGSAYAKSERDAVSRTNVRCSTWRSSAGAVVRQPTSTFLARLKNRLHRLVLHGLPFRFPLDCLSAMADYEGHITPDAVRFRSSNLALIVFWHGCPFPTFGVFETLSQLADTCHRDGTITTMTAPLMTRCVVIYLFTSTLT